MVGSAADRRADGRAAHAADTVLGVIPAHDTAPPSDRGPSGRSVAPVTTGDLVAGAVQRWRAGLLASAGESALSDIDRLGDALLDLSAAHPAGIAPLYAGRPTRLSNLVREGVALAQAKRRARAVGVAAEEHALRSGLATSFLAIGIASWTETDHAHEADSFASVEVSEDTVPRTVGEDTLPRRAPEPARRLRAPVLLRPVTVTPRGRGEADYDLLLEPSLEINPLLAAALRSRGALLDPSSLARGAFTAAGFDPRPALDRLGSLGVAVLPDFELTERVLVGTFVHPEQMLVDDLDALAPRLADHEVIAALAGDPRAASALAHPLPPALAGDRGVDQERGIGDLDPTQAHVLDVLAAGHHLMLDTPPGSDVAGTVAAVVADAAAAGRRVLYVAGHRRAAVALTERLAALGLDDLVLDVAPDSGWRTQVDIGPSIANGIEDVGLGSIVTALRTGNKDVAIRGLGSLFARIPSAFMEAVNHIATGNKSMMRSFELEAKQAMEGGNLLASDDGRQMWDRGGWRSVPGGFMVFFGRMMTALDHVNSASTREGAKAMAL